MKNEVKGMKDSMEQGSMDTFDIQNMIKEQL